ncbi:MAG: amino acid ABC transporter permease [Victivallales bacterium]|nr:amino acid ABC transporter permease [Victivallales bacterium]
MSFSDMLLQLLLGLITSLELFLLTLLFALPFGLLIALCRMARNWPLRNLARIYISIMRGTPLMLQLIIVYFGPYYLFKMSLRDYPAFLAVVIAFVLNYAAYFAEIYRGGISSIPIGQYEAAEVLGYSRCQTFFKIILPQVVKRILPPITNEVITLVKDTSLAQVLAVTEMFTLAKQIANAQSSLTALLVAGIFYYVLNFLVAMLMERIEQTFNYYR